MKRIVFLLAGTSSPATRGISMSAEALKHTIQLKQTIQKLCLNLDNTLFIIHDSAICFQTFETFKLKSTLARGHFCSSVDVDTLTQMLSAFSERETIIVITENEDVMYQAFHNFFRDHSLFHGRQLPQIRNRPEAVIANLSEGKFICIKQENGQLIH